MGCWAGSQPPAPKQEGGLFSTACGMRPSARSPWFLVYFQAQEVSAKRLHAPPRHTPCVHAKLLQSVSQFYDPIDYSQPGSSVHGILQTRILEWVAMPSSRESSQPRDQTHVSYISCIGQQLLYHQCHLGSPTPSPAAPKLPSVPIEGFWGWA